MKTPPHLRKWKRGQPFPPRKVCNPPLGIEGLWIGTCVVCGGSLGGPYQEDLIHEECEKQDVQV